MASRPVSELDFIRVKEELKNYLRTNPTFTDYDFEGSALSLLLDVMAYNTQYIGYYANMLHNEGFLDTAQKRESVVSRAKELGYTPRSARASSTLVNVEVEGVPPNAFDQILKRGFPFSSRNDKGSFTFVAVEDTTLSRLDTGDVYQNVEIKEGVLISNTFFVENTESNQRALYKIPNKDVDIATLKVYVRENFSSGVVEEYTPALDILNLNPTKRVFFVQESHDGFFEIFFGDDVLGKKLENGNVVEISYIVSQKELANGCKTFNIGGAVNSATNAFVVASGPSVGGKDKESLDSIKTSAVRRFSTQNRAVTANDYVALLEEKIPEIKSLSVWGGEDNIPPVYGKVFLSAQPVEGLVFTQSFKDNVIVPEADRLSMLTVKPEVVDPEYSFIAVDCSVKFDKNRTPNSFETVKQGIQNAIISYFNENLQVFGRDLYASKLAEIIDNVDTGIVSSTTKLINSFRINPILGVTEHFSKVEGNRILRGSVQSSKFKSVIGFSEKTCFIKDNPNRIVEKLDRFNRQRIYGVLELIDNTNNEYIQDVGTVEYSTEKLSEAGRFEFDITVSDFINNEDNIMVYFKTEDGDVTSFRNQILLLDPNVYSIETGILAGLSVNLIRYEK